MNRSHMTGRDDGLNQLIAWRDAFAMLGCLLRHADRHVRIT
jgi:hypothetical protein